MIIRAYLIFGSAPRLQGNGKKNRMRAKEAIHEENFFWPERYLLIQIWRYGEIISLIFGGVHFLQSGLPYLMKLFETPCYPLPLSETYVLIVHTN